MRFLAAAAAAILATAVQAQEWPAKPVRIVVPFPAGGSADLMPRIVAEKLTEKWGQPVIVDNRPGAAGNIGADAVFRADPDGYTLMSSPPPPLVINKLLYPKLSYDPDQFVPISVIGAIPNVLLVHPSVGANSVAELVAIAKANPGKLNYASQGSGTTSHLTAELFKAMAGGLQITHIPYKGTAPALTDLLAGQVDMMCDNLGVSLPHVRSGKLKALAVASKRRFAGLPDVPALAETLPGFESIAGSASSRRRRRVAPSPRRSRSACRKRSSAPTCRSASRIFRPSRWDSVRAKRRSSCARKSNAGVR